MEAQATAVVDEASRRRARGKRADAAAGVAVQLQMLSGNVHTSTPVDKHECARGYLWDGRRAVQFSSVCWTASTLFLKFLH